MDTARHIVDGWKEDICDVWLRRNLCKRLKRAMGSRRAFSGGERSGKPSLESRLSSSADFSKIGDGWPDRERRISWSILGRDSHCRILTVSQDRESKGIGIVAT